MMDTTPSTPSRAPWQALCRATAGVLCASAMLLTAAVPARAQSELSVGLSTLPLASVVGAVSVAGATASTVVALPAALAVSGAVLTVKAIEVSATGTVLVLESASDAADVSLQIASVAGGALALSVGASVVTTVIASGVILSAAGEAIAFVPNAIGRALLHNEKLG